MVADYDTKQGLIGQKTNSNFVSQILKSQYYMKWKEYKIIFPFENNMRILKRIHWRNCTVNLL